MYGENGEVEYGGDMKNSEKPTIEIMIHRNIIFLDYLQIFGLIRVLQNLI